VLKFSTADTYGCHPGLWARIAQRAAVGQAFKVLVGNWELWPESTSILQYDPAICGWHSDLWEEG